MSRNGSGTQSSPISSFPAVADTLIEASKFNTVVNDINAALTASIANDGQTPILANLPMSGFKHTGAVAAASAGEYVEYAQLNTLLAALTPAGTVIYFAGQTAPTGYLAANGASLSTTTYANLFSAIGYTFGGSGGSFLLPDLRGEFLRGWIDDRSGVDAGRAFGSYQANSLQRHNHYLPTGSGSAGSGASIPDTNWATDQLINVTPSSGTIGLTVDASGVPEGSGNSGTQGTFTSETRPRNIALLACIKY